MRRTVTLIVALALLAAAPVAEAAESHSKVRRVAASAMRDLGSSSGMFILDATERDVVYEHDERRSRIIASNTKLFTTAAALAQFSPDGTLGTTVVGVGEKRESGTFAGNLYIRGGGDPTLGRDEIEELARQLAEEAGIDRVTGRVLGDESAWDSRRGGPDSNFGPSPWHAQLSALSYDWNGRLRGRTPPEAAARALTDALEDRRVPVRASARVSAVPSQAGGVRLAAVESPEMARLVRLTNKESSNFMAEMLLKALSAADGDEGTTKDGARDAYRFAKRLGSRPRLRDGSGLSRGNRASPEEVVELLDEMRDRDEFDAFYDSLAIAGVDGTLDDSNHRGLRRGSARRRCRGKTGTLRGVSALSGYCRASSGDTIVFSILSNGVRSTNSAKRIEDRIVQAIARYG
ncbi:MAG: D-alanyl-D-alanine carboxypeptidase/D-alanyl-D-alanine-endopeptidase [Thermoleophilaceae bacterium]